MRTLAGKRVVVTGAAQGIGRAIALRMAQAGADLVLTDWNEAALPAAQAEVQALGRVAWTYRLDVTDRAGIAQVRRAIADEVGPIDVLVNNAGTVFGGAFLDVPLEKHWQTYQINTLGLVAVTHVFLPDLIARPEAHLVNIASASAYVGLPFGTTYASSKWAAMGFSEGLRLELAELGQGHVKVTTVNPAYVATGLFEGAKAPRLTQFLTPERLAEQVVQGVLADQPLVLAPKSVVRISPFLRGVLPVRWFDAVGRWFGITTSMQHWRGHVAPAQAPRPSAAPSPAARPGGAAAPAEEEASSAL